MTPYASASVLADSVSSGVRLTTLLVRMPRFVLAEFNTHRMFSRNSASSRAIPVAKRVAAVREDPFVPPAFGRNRAGMSAGAALEEEADAAARGVWLRAARLMADCAEELASVGVHKQHANRLLEPFLLHDVIVTATEWSNFLHLRVSEHAQPEIRAVAESMRDAMAASEPRPLRPGEWHLPLVRVEDLDRYGYVTNSADEEAGRLTLARLSAARCARVSYLTHDGRRDPEEDLRLAASLEGNGHMSPFEHPAFVGGPAYGHGGLCEQLSNLRPPWVQLRKLIPREADRLGE
jgi:hypothetical protein